jgi:hypothetical protein
MRGDGVTIDPAGIGFSKLCNLRIAGISIGIKRTRLFSKENSDGVPEFGQIRLASYNPRCGAAR